MLLVLFIFLFRPIEGVIDGQLDLWYNYDFTFQLLGDITIIPGITLSDRYAQVTNIDGKHLLTAAHVVNNSNPNLISVKICSQIQDIGISYEIERIIVHESFNILSNSLTTYSINDIAIIVLKNTISQTFCSSQIQLANTAVPTGSTSTVIGWGQYSMIVPLGSLFLRYTTMQIYDFDQCNQLYLDIINEGHICAINTNGKGPCSGDSGGPLISGTNTQIGITTFAKDCASPTYPSVFTNVTYYLPWIQSKINV